MTRCLRIDWNNCHEVWKWEGVGVGGVGNGCCLHILEVACGISHTRVGGAETTTRSGRTSVPEMLLDVVVVVVGSAIVMG